MRWLKSFRSIDRVPEFFRCLRRCRRPGGFLRRYLAGGERGYPYVLELRDGVRVELENFHDLVTAWVVFVREEYHVEAGTGTFLDLGANIGCFSLFAAARCPSARIVAIEPFPSTYDRLSSNLSRNLLADRATCWPIGVAAGSGIRRMVDEGEASQSRGILPAEAATAAGIEVEVLSLSELLSRACDQLQSATIDFVKIDIEGGEHEALLSCSPEGLRPIRRLGMEYHPNRPKRPLFDHLAAAGFRVESDRRFGPDVGVAHFVRT